MELGIRYPGSGGAREKTQVRSNLQAEVMCLYLGSGVVSDTRVPSAPGVSGLEKGGSCKRPKPTEDVRLRGWEASRVPNIGGPAGLWPLALGPWLAHSLCLLYPGGLALDP